ncbi:MAG: ATP-binding cassette domain-containing protein [Alphaproteobacteria bacterium]|nr:ATP-binding cassette domain-containing protein [Alphaproteobacteria bacterium]
MTAHSKSNTASRVLRVQSLSTHFDLGFAMVRAVDDVDFEVERGEILGLVGESGSGKTVAGLSILGLVEPPGEIIHGSVFFEGRDLTRMPDNEIRQIRGNRISMIFQDPLTTLSPTMRIGKQMQNVIAAHHRIARRDARVRCRDALGKLGISSPEERLNAYPHELSGGMRQRVCIAMAMLNEPDLIIADEPTTALDVTTQAQILQEIKLLRERTGAAFIWITHDLAVVSELADRLVVMYSGQIVEEGTAAEVLSAPKHPYTHGLLQSVPAHNRDLVRLPQIPGFAPTPVDRIAGCKFGPRCKYAQPKCQERPGLQGAVSGRLARCFFPLDETGDPAEDMR